MVSSIAALAVKFWLPELSHMPLFALTHSLIGGVVIAFSSVPRQRQNGLYFT